MSKKYVPSYKASTSGLDGFATQVYGLEIGPSITNKSLINIPLPPLPSTKSDNPWLFTLAGSTSMYDPPISESQIPFKKNDMTSSIFRNR